MNRIYKKPLTEIVDLSVQHPVMGTGDAAGSTGANGDDAWANNTVFEVDEPADYAVQPKGSLWDE
jgi:hypothetical protein